MYTSTDLLAEKESLLNELPEELGQYYSENDEIMEFIYPVRQYPAKVNSLNFDKTPIIEGEVNGLRGQYLMLADGQVLNIRRLSGYFVDFEVL